MRSLPAGVDPELRRRRTLAALTLLALALSVAAAAPFLPALIWALTLAIVAQPLQRLIGRRVRHAGARAGLTTALLAALVLIPTIAVVPLVANEAAGAWEELRSESVQSRVAQLVHAHPALAPLVDWLRRHLPAGPEVAARVAAMVPGLMTGSVWIGLQWLIAFFATFYLLRDGEPMRRWVGQALPMPAAQFQRLQQRAAEVVEASVVGSLSVAAVQGALGGLMFWMLGLPAPLLWGLVMALLSVLPVMGAALVWIPAALFLALEGDWQKALILVAWGGIAVGLIDNLLYPMLVSRKLRLHTLPVFVAILGGLLVFGASGLVLGPLVLAMAAELLLLWRQEGEAGPEPP